MKDNIFEFIDHKESKHWWFVARTNILKAQVEKYNDEIENFLDIGCGTGYFLSKISPIVENAYGVDPHEYKNLKIDNIISGTVENLPFGNNTFDFVSCLDVLEHVENAEEGLNSILRVLKPGGFAIVTVPACQWLYGPHDKDNEHVKRFNKSEFESMINPRFEIMKSTYFNSFLFPAEAPIRLLERMTNKSISKGETENQFLNKLFFKIFNAEKKWLLKHNLPIGMSYMIILRKRK